MNTIVVVLFASSILSVSVVGQRNFGQNGDCLVPNRYVGVCMTLSRCPIVAQQYGQFRGSQQGKQYILSAQASCGTRSIRGDPVVCCGQFVEYRPPIQPTTTIATTAVPTTRTTRATTTTTTTTVRPPSPPPTSTSVPLNTPCRGPDLLEGTCISLRDCPVLMNYIQSNSGNDAAVRQLKLSNEICGFRYAVVCCPLNTNSQARDNGNNEMVTQSNLPFIFDNNQEITKLPTVKEGCGVSNNTFNKIVGGEASKLGAWPWITLLGYETSLDESPFKCGGTMITVRHILTAAHCIRKNLKFVRLGEHDLSTNLEAKHVDIDIAKTSVHEDYSSQTGHSDIAILRLVQNVPLSEHILPACVPTSRELITKSYIGFNPFVVGWGRTMEGGKSANVLQELQIPILENTVCRESYIREGRLRAQIDDGVICAGFSEGGRDTCQGDSGGPLLFPERVSSGEIRFYVIGIVSYGIGCARANIPGVYTSVTQFVDWIERKVAEVD